MSDNVNLNNKETIENLLKKYKEENSELYQNVKDVVDDNTKWENNGFGRDGNLLQLLILEYIDGNEEMVNQINDRIGKVRFGNVRPSYDFRIRKTIDVNGEDKEVSITSAFYKKYRYDNDIKAEVVPYKENDEEKCLIVLYDKDYTSDILEDNVHKTYNLPGIDLENLDEIKETFFEQLDIALDREVHIDKEEKEQEEIKEVAEKVIDKEVEETAQEVTEEVKDSVEEIKEEIKDKQAIKEEIDAIVEDEEIKEEKVDENIEEKEDKEENKVEEEKIDEEQEVVESVDGVIEEAPEDEVEEKEETVPVVKEDLPKERLEFISNDLFKTLTLTYLENTKKQIAIDLRNLTKEEVEALREAKEYNDENVDVKEDVKENRELANKKEIEEIGEIDVVPMSEIKEYDHKDDELGSDNPMIVDRSDEIPEEIKEQIIKEDKELRKNKHFKEDRNDR